MNSETAQRRGRLTVGMFILGLVVGPLAGRIGAKNVVVGGPVIMIIPFVVLAVGHTEGWQIYAAVGVLGVGLGLGFSSMAAIVVAAVLTASTPVAHRFPADSGYSTVFWLLAVVSVAAALASLLIPPSTPWVGRRVVG